MNLERYLKTCGAIGKMSVKVENTHTVALVIFLTGCIVGGIISALIFLC